MKRNRPPRPRVKLNRDAVWELLDRLGMSWNEPARRTYGNAADLHHPRPGDGQIRDSTLPLRRPNPGRDQGHRRDTPRASLPPLGPGNTDEGGAPSLRITTPTPTPTNTQLRKCWSARGIPRSAGTPGSAPAEPSGSWTWRGNPPASGQYGDRYHTRTPSAT